jgi:3-dehydroquinate dehydratase / shikimate dehydrogenase
MNKVAASISLPTTEECLTEIERLSPWICAAEIRLDLMDQFDLRRLVESAHVPLAITYRPTREGGRFDGDESERLSVLRQAVEMGAAYIDVECDTLDRVADWDLGSTKLIASCHWYDTMPSEFIDRYEQLRDRVDVVKLVGTADRTSDIAPVLELLRHANSPVISMAMGAAGSITRILAPWFRSCELTYGATSPHFITAPGQLTVEEMVRDLHLDRLNPHTAVQIYLFEHGLLKVHWTDDGLVINLPAIDVPAPRLRDVLRATLADMNVEIS